MLYQPTLVSKDFYALVKKTNPLVIREPRYARFLDHLLFGSFRDEETNLIVSPESLLADIENLGHTLYGNSRNYNRALKFPSEFEEDTGLKLDRLPYYYSKGRAAAYEINNLPQELLQALEIELSNPVMHKYDGVYLDKGKSPTASDAKSAKRLFIERKERYMAENISIARPDIHFLNASSRSSAFLDRGFETRLQEAKITAGKIPNNDGKGAEKMAHAIRTLNRFSTFEPFYEAKNNTDRIYTNGTSLQNLSSNIRKSILKPSKNYDLTAAQLAIMSTHWDVPEIQNLVRTGDVWKILCQSLGIMPWKKGEAKRLVYATAFGMTLDNLAIRYGQSLGHLSSDSLKNKPEANIIEHYSNLLEENIYLGALLKGRKRAMSRIQKSKQAIDSHGEIRSAKYFSTSYKGGHKLRTSAPDTLGI